MKLDCPAKRNAPLQSSTSGRAIGRCIRQGSRLLAALTALLASASAMAAAGGGPYGTISYAPLDGQAAVSPTAIPTMGGAGLVLLSAFLLVIFWRLHRRGAAQGARFMVLALASGALVSGVGGLKLHAMASNGIFVYMDNETGGNLTVYEADGNLYCVSNATDVPLRITQLENLHSQPIWTDTDNLCGSDVGDSPQHAGCVQGKVMAPEEVCGVLLLSQVN